MDAAQAAGKAFRLQRDALLERTVALRAEAHAHAHARYGLQAELETKQRLHQEGAGSHQLGTYDGFCGAMENGKGVRERERYRDDDGRPPRPDDDTYLDAVGVTARCFDRLDEIHAQERLNELDKGVELTEHRQRRWRDQLYRTLFILRCG